MTVSPAPSPFTAPERPVLDMLREILAIWERESRDPQGPPRTQLSAMGARFQLGRIYGFDLAQLRRSFPFPNEPSDGPVPPLGRQLEQLRRIVDSLNRLLSVTASAPLGQRVFIGHGRSGAWKDLKAFIAERLGLPWDEFTRVASAGDAISRRLEEMLSDATFALLVFTAEDEQQDGSVQARANVIHELGLFQGRLGLRRAIVLLEEGCREFSNIVGLSQIRFPSDNIAACFDEVRRVLEREGLT